MTKNAFEIRSDILALAKAYLDNQAKLNSEFAHALINAGQTNVQEMQEALKKMYSLDEIMKTAERMYGFVEKSDKK